MIRKPRAIVLLANSLNQRDKLILITAYSCRFSHLADGVRDREPCGVRPPPAAVEHDGDMGPAWRGADVPRRVRGGEHRIPNRNGQFS